MWRKCASCASSIGTRVAPRRIGNSGRLFPLGARRQNEAPQSPELGVPLLLICCPRCEGHATGLQARLFRANRSSPLIRTPSPAPRYRIPGRKVHSHQRVGRRARGGEWPLHPILTRAATGSIFLLPARVILWEIKCRREGHEKLPNVPRKLSEQLCDLPGRWQPTARGWRLDGGKCHSREIPPTGQSGAGRYGFCLQGSTFGI